MNHCAGMNLRRRNLCAGELAMCSGIGKSMVNLGGYGIERNGMKQPEPEPRPNSEHHVPLPESKGTLSRETPEQPLTKYQYQNNQPVQEPVPVTNAKPGRLT
jgi:hypothetical protein